MWLTWFTVSVLEGFVPIAQRQKDPETVRLCQDWVDRLRTAAQNAWDGAWYLRGWYDDGAPLGSHASEECQIDSIAQSWAALTPGTDRQQAQRAVAAALERLFDREHQVVKLFTPAFDGGQTDPGYIRGYLPGVRENGGQYTHAAVWLALACYELGMEEAGYELLRALLPAAHPMEHYRAEPYVLAADVYANPAHLGRGGWSWYTGAAGWYQQAVWRGLLGMEVKAGNLTIRPQLPADWPGCSLRWSMEEAELHIVIRRGETAVTRLDGKEVSAIPLKGLTGEHQVEVVVSRPPRREALSLFSSQRVPNEEKRCIISSDSH